MDIINTMVTILLLCLYVLLFLLLIRFIYIYGKKLIPFLHFGAIYIGVPQQTLKRMISHAHIKNGERIIDLGSGDGRIIIEAAKMRAIATGIEIDKELVTKSHKNITKAKVTKNANIIQGSFWKHNVSQYDVVFVYGINYIMARLEKKLQNELKPGARVVSAYFQFPNLKPEIEDHGVRVYKIS